MIAERIKKCRVIPVIALEDAGDSVPLCKALKAGGLEIAEITFRTAAAREAIRIVAEEFPEFALGAGTVTTIEELETAKEAGAQFAVAPGFNPRIVTRAQELDLPFFPGICTPSDVEGAMECGCKILKFFPAETAGGIKTIKALYGPYSHKGISFIPTGGINADNLADYLSTPGVIAIGGSWMVSKSLLQAKEWDKVTGLARVAAQIASDLN